MFKGVTNLQKISLGVYWGHHAATPKLNRSLNHLSDGWFDLKIIGLNGRPSIVYV